MEDLSFVAYLTRFIDGIRADLREPKQELAATFRAYLAEKSRALFTQLRDMRVPQTDRDLPAWTRALTFATELEGLAAKAHPDRHVAVLEEFSNRFNRFRADIERM